MLVQALGITEDELTVERIRALVNDGLDESDVLELKGERLKDNAEFARRIAALANNNGGVMIIGVPDEKESDRSFRPLAFEPNLTDLQRVIHSRIEPPITVKAHPVVTDTSNPTQGIIVFEIPRQPRVPYAVTREQRIYFDIKAGREIRPLTEREIERMYRDRFRRDANVFARLQNLTESYPEMTDSHVYPHLSVAIVPLSPLPKLFVPTPRVQSALTQFAKGETHSLGIQHFPHVQHVRDKLLPIFGYGDEGQMVPSKARPGFKRIEMTSFSFERKHLSELGWVEIHDDGAYYAFIPLDDEVQGRNGELRKGWYDVGLTHEILRTLATYWLFAIAFKIDSEVVIQASIPYPASLELWPTNRSVRRPYSTEPLTNPIATTTYTTIDQLTVGPQLLQTAKPLLDDVFTAFRWPECDVINPDGELFAGAFDQRHWDQYVRPWAEMMGILKPSKA